MRLVWSSFALEDRVAIFDYIEQDNPRAAIRTDERIQRSIEKLNTFPEMDRIGRTEGTRELAIANTPDVATYRIVGRTGRILRILDGAQTWPDDLSEITEP